jgi:hypothetical protein
MNAAMAMTRRMVIRVTVRAFMRGMVAEVL